jgi:hypothetical protein
VELSRGREGSHKEHQGEHAGHETGGGFEYKGEGRRASREGDNAERCHQKKALSQKKEIKAGNERNE